MTVAISVSVNGNYKVPIHFTQGDRNETIVVSGRDSEGPRVVTVPFYHGPDIMTMEIGPESEDLGE